MAQRRVVRRTPWLTRIKAYPFDTFLYLHEQFETVEWDALSSTVPLPLGLTLDALLLVSRICSKLLNVSEGPRTDVLDGLDTSIRHSPLAGDVFQGRRPSISLSSWISRCCTLLSFTLLLVSIANAYYVFTRKRTYTLLAKSPQDTGMASNSSSRRTRLNFNEPDSSLTDSPWRKIINKLRTRALTQDLNSDTWELQMWNPSIFNLYLFSSFSPLHTFTLYSVSYSSLFTRVLICLAITAQMYLLISMFTQQVKDKSIVFGEMFDEYEKKVVKPKLSVTRSDASVGTDGTVEFSTPMLDKQFVLRDVRPWSVPSSAMSSPIGKENSSPFRMAALVTAQQGGGIGVLRQNRASGIYECTPVKFKSTAATTSGSSTPNSMGRYGYTQFPMSRSSTSPSKRIRHNQE
ncbi:hypothetical protein V1512DRAFT_255934 [Lipomyces arxii]|uniref:uncharacterized protein n=1 Tax=Lipomyces arxii TaxID=56418 RepID=UPI0034CF53AD